MLCANIPPLPEEDRFIGCDGKVLSSELLMAQLKSAIDREDFEDAAIIRDELNRRVKEIFESIYEGQELKTVASKQTTLNKGKNLGIIQDAKKVTGKKGQNQYKFILNTEY